MRKLGENQRGVMSALMEHGHWDYGAQWTWGTYSGTVRILESLERRGLVACREAAWAGRAFQWHSDKRCWYLTEEGIKLAKGRMFE